MLAFKVRAPSSSPAAKLAAESRRRLFIFRRLLLPGENAGNVVTPSLRVGPLLRTGGRTRQKARTAVGFSGRTLRRCFGCFHINSLVEVPLWCDAVSFVSQVVVLTGKEPGTFHKLGIGALAGLIAQSCTYPLEVTRRRMQTHGLVDTQAGVKKVSNMGIQHFHAHQGVLVGAIFPR